MPQRLTVKNNETGQTITFDWHDPNPPTEADMEQIFAEAAPRRGASGSWDTPDSRAEALAAADPNYLPTSAAEGGARRVDTAVQWAKENPGTVGAMAAGLAVAPFTGGMSALPMMALEGAAAGSGYMAGDVVGRAAQGQEQNLGETAQGAVKEGVFAGLTAGVGPALKATGRELYHLALKPRLAMSHTPQEVAQLIDTGFAEGINVSRSGFQKAGRLIGEQVEEVRKLIAGLNETGDVRRGLEKIKAFRDRWAKGGMLDEELRAIDDVADQYMQRFQREMPLEDLQQLKQDIWYRTSNNWDQNLPPVKKEAQMEFGSGLRETIEDVARRRNVPDIGVRNERIGNLIDLQDTISGRAAHEAAPGLRQAVEVTGGATPGYVMRAVATSAPVLSSVGRKMASVGKFLDPRTFAPTASHVITDERRLLPAHAIELGPSPDPSFAKGVPSPRNPRPVRGYLPEATDIEQLPQRAGSTDPIGEVSLLDESGRMKTVLPENAGKTPGGLDIPEQGAPYQPNTLDQLDIPEMRKMFSPDELWVLKRLREMDPRLERLGLPEWKRLIQETIESEARGQGPVGPKTLTKARIEALYRSYLAEK